MYIVVITKITFIQLFTVVNFLGVLDYVEIEQDVIISAANNRQCFNISITDDTLLEENEYFELTLTNIRNRVSNTYIHQIPIQVANITVLDDDGNLN